ncbi:MAG: winged helix-turn-helix domain-containing protein [Eubacteriales bacterium]
MKLEQFPESEFFQRMELICYLELMALEVEKQEKIVLSWAKDFLSKHFLEDKEEFLEDVALLQQFFDQVNESLPLEEITLLKYFAPLKNQDDFDMYCSVAGVLFQRLPALCFQLKCSEIEGIYTLICRILLSQPSDLNFTVTGEMEIVGENEFWDYLENYPIPDEKKWKIHQLCKHWEKYRAEILTIFPKIKDIYERNLPMLQPLLDKYYPEIESAWASYDEKTWGEKYPFTVENADNLKGFFSFSHFNAVSFIRAIEEGEETFILASGVFFHKLHHMAQEQITTETLSKTLKSMGETRKFEILLSLLDSPCNGKELAVRLSLTPATISHHISPMMEGGLITMNRVNTKNPCYQVNTTRILENLDRLKDIFGENDTHSSSS